MDVRARFPESYSSWRCHIGPQPHHGPTGWVANRDVGAAGGLEAAHMALPDGSDTDDEYSLPLAHCQLDSLRHVSTSNNASRRAFRAAQRRYDAGIATLSNQQFLTSNDFASFDSLDTIELVTQISITFSSK